jgi:hypothetical protein
MEVCISAVDTIVLPEVCSNTRSPHFPRSHSPWEERTVLSLLVFRRRVVRPV